MHRKKELTQVAARYFRQTHPTDNAQNGLAAFRNGGGM
jgi:hypothetical protein